MPAFDITTQTGEELPLDGNRRGEARFQVANRLGRPAKAAIRVEAADTPAAKLSWLSVEPKAHSFATGGSKVVRVTAELPEGVEPGRYGFRLTLVPEADAASDTAADDSAAESATSAVTWIRAGSARQSRMALIAIVLGLLAIIGLGGYWLFLAPPACDEVARSVYDSDAKQCVCPSGTTQALLAGQATCVCDAGTAYDEDSAACIPRSCTTERALYAEISATCGCPANTNEVDGPSGKKCVCSLGQRYDTAARECVAQACGDELADSFYDDTSNRCACPADATQVAADADGPARCVCPAGRKYYDPEHRCARLPDLAVIKFDVFPPLIQQRMFSALVTVKNQGDIPAGRFRLELSITGSGIDDTHSKEYEQLMPGQAIVYEPTRTRTNDDSEIEMKARVIPLDYEDGSEDNNSGSQIFDIAYARKQTDRPADE